MRYSGAACVRAARCCHEKTWLERDASVVSRTAIQASRKTARKARAHRGAGRSGRGGAEWRQCSDCRRDRLFREWRQGGGTRGSKRCALAIGRGATTRERRLSAIECDSAQFGRIHGRERPNAISRFHRLVCAGTIASFAASTSAIAAGATAARGSSAGAVSTAAAASTSAATAAAATIFAASVAR